MQESIKAAITVVKTRCHDLGIEVDQFDNKDIHIHVPEGATPKDGPSAGAAITAAMYSLFTGKPIPPRVAMTGEVCLQGKVTAIGGLGLKILGGIRAGVRHFLYPADNHDQFVEFKKKHDESTLKDIQFTEVECIDEEGREACARRR